MTSDRVGYSLLVPTVYFVWNSNLPYSLNDGALWAGRGLNASVTPGVAARYQGSGFAIRMVVAPTFVASQNRPFQIFHGADSSRSPFSSPWHIGTASADLPLRFGARPVRTVTTGESSIEVVADRVSAGISSASDWWGPGARNALVLSDNAAGVPRAFVKSTRPVNTRVGRVAAELILGTLTESQVFDTVSANDYRSLSGIQLTLRPAADTSLTLGFARVVYAPSSGAVPSPSRALDALVRWEPLASPTDTLPNGKPRQHADQIFSLFGSYDFPSAGTRLYAEWARMEPPRSLREWLVAPQSTQAYTVGLQTTHTLARRGTALRAQLELTDLEQPEVFPNRPPPDFYTGRVSPQGYTQRGQIVGAAIGPGGSSQWAGIDYITPGWQLGAFAGRTRWENDALFRQSRANPSRHDVTIYSGLRGAMHALGFTTSSELTIGRRLNYLFQNDAYNAGETPRSAVDVQNVTMEFQISR